MAWSNPTTRATGYKVTAANWNELVNDLKHLMEVAYVEFTAPVTITAQTVGAAQGVVSLGAVTYEAVPHLFEFYCPRLQSANGAMNVILRDGTTVLGTLGATGTLAGWPVFMATRFTPSAASHSYNIAAWSASANVGSLQAGTGGAAGDGTSYLPGWMRATRVPI